MQTRLDSHIKAYEGLSALQQHLLHLASSLSYHHGYFLLSICSKKQNTCVLEQPAKSFPEVHICMLMPQPPLLPIVNLMSSFLPAVQGAWQQQLPSQQPADSGCWSPAGLQLSPEVLVALLHSLQLRLQLRNPTCHSHTSSNYGLWIQTPYAVYSDACMQCVRLAKAVRYLPDQVR